VYALGVAVVKSWRQGGPSNLGSDANCQARRSEEGRRRTLEHAGEQRTTHAHTELFGAAQKNRNVFLSYFTFYSVNTKEQDHAVVSRTPRSENVHPRAHDADSPVIPGLCELISPPPPMRTVATQFGARAHA